MQTLEELEREAKLAYDREQQAIIDRWTALKEIRNRRLYLDHAETWADYLKARHNIKPSFWDSLQANAKAAIYLRDEHGVEFGNQQAIREMRTIVHRAMTEEVVPLVLEKAQEAAGADNPIEGKHIRAVMETTVEVLKTGHVVVRGKSVAFNAAIDEATTEAIQREKQYAADGAKKSGWSPAMLIKVDGSGTGYIWIDGLLPNARNIEVKWRVIEQVNDA